jgi:hypothetical protein
MSAKLTWLRGDGQPHCGHRLDQGYAGPGANEWLCEACRESIDAKRNQEIVAADEAAQRRAARRVQ